MRRLAVLLLLVPALAFADDDEDAFAPCEPGPLLIHEPPAGWGVGGGRCLSLPADLVDFCDMSPEDRSDARLVTGEIVGDTVEGAEVVPSELVWLPTGRFDPPLAGLCPTVDVLPLPLFVAVEPPAWDPLEVGYRVDGQPDAGALLIPVHAGPVPPPQAPAFELRRLRNDEMFVGGSAILGDHLGFAATLRDGADTQSIVHVLRTDADGVPTLAPELADAPPDEWRAALRVDGSESLRASRAAVESPLRPRIEGTFRAHSLEETCWVAVVEAGDTSWSAPSETVCAEPTETPAPEPTTGCAAPGPPPALGLLLLAGPAIPRRGRRRRPRR